MRVTLCSSCVDASDCVNRYVRGYDVLFCDMFRDSGRTVVEDDGAENRTVLVWGKQPRRKSDPSEFKGLCQNCIYRGSCALPRPKTGVWHCEEYEELP